MCLLIFVVYPLCCVLPVLAAGQGGRTIRVSRGSFTYIQPEDVMGHVENGEGLGRSVGGGEGGGVQPGAACRVHVVTDDLASLRVGRVEPQV